MLDLDEYRQRLAPVLEPSGRLLARLGVSPEALTFSGIAITALGALLVGSGRLTLGALTVAVGSGLDALDGAVARAMGKTSRRGAFLDSFSDRVEESLMWAGLAYYVAERRFLVLLCVFSLALSFMISYLRSKLEAEGIEGRGGLMARPDRVILYVLGVATGFVEIMLWLMVVLTSFTLFQRLRRAWLELPQ